MSPFGIVCSKVSSHVLGRVLLPEVPGQGADIDHMTVRKLLKCIKKYARSLKHKITSKMLINIAVHLCKERIPVGTYNMKKMKKYGPFKIMHRIHANACVADLSSKLHISNTLSVYIYEFLLG